METSKIVVEFIPAPHWWDVSKWKLHKKYESYNGHYIAPKGFITDGASIPRFFLRIFSPTGRYFGAAIVHDYILKNPPLYLEENSEDHWSHANNEFKAELKALGITRWRIVFLVSSVRVWGWIKSKILK